MNQTDPLDERTCKRGHSVSGDNAYFPPSSKNSACKLCRNIATNKYRDENRGKVRAKDRERGATKRQSPEYNARIMELNKEYRKRNPEKQKARGQLLRAVYSGRIKRPDTCQECSSKSKIQAHHPDYTKPLEVMWLCLVCHENIHHGKAVV